MNTRLLAVALLLLAAVLGAADGTDDTPGLVRAMHDLAARAQTVQMARAVWERIEAQRNLEAMDLLPGEDPDVPALFLAAHMSLQILGPSVAEPWLTRISGMDHPLAASAAAIRTALADPPGRTAFLDAARAMHRNDGIAATLAMPRFTVICAAGKDGSPFRLEVHLPTMGNVLQVVTSATASVWEMPGEPPWRSPPLWIEFDPIRGVRRDGSQVGMSFNLCDGPTPIADDLGSTTTEVRRLAERLVWVRTGDTWTGSGVLDVVTRRLDRYEVHGGTIRMVSGSQDNSFAVSSISATAAPVVPSLPAMHRSVFESGVMALEAVLRNRDTFTHTERRQMVTGFMTILGMRDMVQQVNAVPRSSADGRQFSDPVIGLIYDRQETRPDNAARVLMPLILDQGRIPDDTAAALDRAVAEGATRAVVLRRWITDAPRRRLRCEALITGSWTGEADSAVP